MLALGQRAKSARWCDPLREASLDSVCVSPLYEWRKRGKPQVTLAAGAPGLPESKESACRVEVLRYLRQENPPA